MSIKKTFFKYLSFDNSNFSKFIMSIYLFFNIMEDNQFIPNEIKVNKQTNSNFNNYEINYNKCIKCNTKIYNNKSTYYAFDHIWCYKCWCKIKI